MSIAIIRLMPNWHNSLRSSRPQARAHENMGMPEAKCHDAKCQEKNLIPQRMRYYRPRQETIASDLFITPNSPRHGEANWKEKNK